MTGEKDLYSGNKNETYDTELPLEGGWFSGSETDTDYEEAMLPLEGGWPEPIEYSEDSLEEVDRSHLGKPEKIKSDNKPEFASDDEELDYSLDKIWDIARKHSLDPFPTIFEVAPARIINQIAAYNIPGRFSHWTFGRSYQIHRTQYEHKRGKIYELVINSDPSEAYLMDNNDLIDNKMVMAHVLGHTDFFKNNMMFAKTDRDMPAVTSRSADRLKHYEEEEGRYEVEKFLDAVLSLEDYSDPYNPNRPYKDEEIEQWLATAQRKIELEKKHPKNINDSTFASGALKKDVINKRRKASTTIPPEPDSDILGFLRNHAPYLEDWQRDVINIVRSEADYFFPQKRTKIMNEGWAAYWHKRIMHEMGTEGFISTDEDEAWSNLHSKIVSESTKDHLNPYHLGMKMFEYLEDYYNGNLSKRETEWLKLEGYPVYPKYEGPFEDSPAIEALRDVMIHNDDQSFMRNYFDKNISDRLRMFSYDNVQMPDGSVGHRVKSNGWMDVRSQLVNMLDNDGTPRISVIESDHARAGELYLRHDFDGRALDDSYINKTLPYLYDIWQRTVHLETSDGDEGGRIVYKYDGHRASTYKKS